MALTRTVMGASTNTPLGTSPDQYQNFTFTEAQGVLIFIMTEGPPTSYPVPSGWTAIAQETANADNAPAGSTLWAHHVTAAESGVSTTVSIPTAGYVTGFSTVTSSINNIILGSIQVLGEPYPGSSATFPAMAPPAGGAWQFIFSFTDADSTSSYAALSISPAPAYESALSRGAFGIACICVADTEGYVTSGTAYTVSNPNGRGYSVYGVLLYEASAPNAPTLTTPANGAYLDVTIAGNNVFTGTYNSTDGANANARAFRIKASSASSYNYLNVSTNALQSTIVWNTVNIAPGASGSFTVPGLANGVTDNWSMADQESLANLQGPFASDFSVNFQVAPNLSINSPTGSETTTNAPSLSYVPTPASGASVTGGRWLIYPLATTQASGFSIDIGAGTIPAGAVSDVSWSGNPLTVAIQSGVTLNNSAGYVAYAAITETGSEWSSTISSSFTISLDQPATPTVTAVTEAATTTTPPYNAVTVQGHDNILSTDDANTSSTLGTLTAGSNTAIALSTAETLGGPYSVSLTSAAAGAMSMSTSASAYAVEPNTDYTIMSWYMAAATAESCRTDVAWYTSTGVLISTTQGTTITDSTSGWTPSIAPVTSPSNAAYAQLVDNVLNTAAASEVHYSAQRGIAPGDTSAIAVPSGGYAYQDSNVTATHIEVDILTTVLGDFFFGCDSSGAGYMARLDSRGTGNFSGFATTSSWTGWNAPGGISPETANVWHHFDIEIASGVATLTIDGVLADTLAVTLLGDYFGFIGDGGGGYTEYRNLFINGVQISTDSLAAYTLTSTSVPYMTAVWTRGGLVGSTVASILRSDGLYVRLASSVNPASIPSPSQSVTINDYEITPGVEYTYTVQVSATLSANAVITSYQSAPTTPLTLVTTAWYEFDPLAPTTTCVSANPTDWTPVNTEQSAAHMVTGQQTLNIVANKMLHQDFSATFEIFDMATYDGFEALLNSQHTIFISSPWGKTDTGYFRVGPQTGGMSSGMGNKTKNTKLLPSTASAPHRTVQITAVAQNRPNV